MIMHELLFKLMWTFLLFAIGAQLGYLTSNWRTETFFRVAAIVLWSLWMISALGTIWTMGPIWTI